ncbi:hypothetical protein [Persephonella sp.]
MKTTIKRPKTNAGTTKDKTKLIADHNKTKTAPILNKNKGANRKNNPKAKIPFTAPI